MEQSAVDQRADHGLALSFFAFLLEAYRPQALQAFLRQYDPRQPE